MQNLRFWLGECQHRLSNLVPGSVMSVVTDPPYGIGFGGRDWDHPDTIAFDKGLWTLVYQVLVPGGQLRVMGSTRTYHRLVKAIVEAGFTLQPLQGWCYSEGIPKFANVEKGLKKLGLVSEAESWKDWWCHLTPAWEPIVCASKGPLTTPRRDVIAAATVVRKPLSERSVAQNVARWSTGALNIGACRISSPEQREEEEFYPDTQDRVRDGRWPKNLILVHRPSCSFVSCAKKCPVLDLDEQGRRMGIHPAGARRERTVNSPYEASSYHICPSGRRMDRYGDFDGASGFYKKFPSSPDLLISYLSALITPESGICIASWDAKDILWSEYQDDSVHGAIAQGDVSKYGESLLRCIRPGGHYIHVNGVEEPTGHTTACYLEDLGFEVRDTIGMVFERGALSYVPKVTSKRERQSGVVGKNDHPTMKPIRLMERILSELPTGLVLDPFAGTGTTAIGSLYSGHDCLCIEQEERYLSIAEQRARFWERETTAWSREVRIESELSSSGPEDDGAVSLLSLLGST